MLQLLDDIAHSAFGLHIVKRTVSFQFPLNAKDLSAIAGRGPQAGARRQGRGGGNAVRHRPKSGAKLKLDAAAGAKDAAKVAVTKKASAKAGAPQRRARTDRDLPHAISRVMRCAALESLQKKIIRTAIRTPKS